MKNLILILLISLFNICLYSQESQVPQINDNTIIVKNCVDSTTFNSTKIILISKGYRIKETDESIGYITTEFKSIQGSTIAIEPEVALSILIKGKDIVLFADYKFKGSAAFGGESYSGRADYQKRPNVGRRLAFDELHSVAKSIGNEIYFTKQ